MFLSFQAGIAIKLLLRPIAYYMLWYEEHKDKKIIINWIISGIFETGSL